MWITKDESRWEYVLVDTVVWQKKLEQTAAQHRSNLSRFKDPGRYNYTIQRSTGNM